MGTLTRQKLRFGPYELDTRSGELFKHGLKLKLQGHPIQILAMLLERPAELITREEIRQRLWPTQADTFVDFEHGLNTAIRKMRQALGDEAETPQYIETLPRRGYRFIGEIAAEEFPQPIVSPPAPSEVGVLQAESAANHSESTAIAAAASVAASLEKEAQRKRLSYRPLLVLVVLPALLAIAALLFRFVRSSPSGLVVTATRQLTYNAGASRSGSIQTDGYRIYFTVTGTKPLRYVSVNGGEATAIPSPASQCVKILHISRDGSYLLVKEEFGLKGGPESPIWLVAANDGTARKLGDIDAQDAAFAPDGKAIVVAKDRDLYLTDMQGASPVKLAQAPGLAYWPRWSPDGQRLRFSVRDPKASESLWELSRSGTLHQLLTDWKRPGGVCCGDWTADGKYFLFRNFRQYWYVSDGSLLRHSEPTLLTTGGPSVWAVAASPLGKTIFVSTILGSFDIFKWDLETNGNSQMYSELKLVSLEFSRDGQWIAYSHKASTGYELWRARVDGSEKLQLTASFNWIYMVRYSPDGRKIAILVNQPDGTWKIYWVSADGGALHEIPNPKLNQADPTWSPDSQSIMFGQPPDFWADTGVPRHLYLYDLRTDKTSEVPGSAGLFSPRWSPDGRYVAAMSLDLQGMSLLNMATGKWRPLARHSTDSPFWSLDGAWVYFNDVAHPGVWRVRVTDDLLEALGPPPVPPGYTEAGCRARAFAPDGAILLDCLDSRTDFFALDYKD